MRVSGTCPTYTNFRVFRWIALGGLMRNEYHCSMWCANFTGEIVRMHPGRPLATNERIVRITMPCVCVIGVDLHKFTLYSHVFLYLAV